ncbi:hypothetical protein A2U01_0086797, partial [Trifolium medium]|nr:hypothetical protein [Trifolium medium]
EILGDYSGRFGMTRRSCLGVGCSHFGMVEQTELSSGNRCWKTEKMWYVENK